MFERFNDRARRVVAQAQKETRLHHHAQVGTEHLLLGLVGSGDDAGAELLTAMDLDGATVRRAVDDIIGQGVDETPDPVPLSGGGMKALELAVREALVLGNDFVGTEHLLLGLIREENGVAARVLARHGVTFARARRLAKALQTSGLKAVLFEKLYARGRVTAP
jgi:ATP-dependent Clp protease ATP-binding subunit ClpC